MTGSGKRLVSVVIPNKDGRRYLADCLESLFKQSFKDFEVIVVDNGSADGSREFIAEKFPSVKLIYFLRAIGFARAVNAGIRESAGEYLALLNTDTMLEEDWLAELVKAAELHPEAGFFASKILRFDDTIDSAGDGLGRDGLGFNIGSGESGSLNFNNQGYCFGACAAAALYRRGLFEEIGLFDEDFGNIFEDTDISFRAQLTGYKCLYVPGAIVYHHRFGTIGTLSKTAVYYSGVNSVNLIVKNMPFKLILRYYLKILFGQYLKSVELLSADKEKLALFKGKSSAVLKLRKMLLKRRKIQGSRKNPAVSLEERLNLRKRNSLGLILKHARALDFSKFLLGILSVLVMFFALNTVIYVDLLNKFLSRDIKIDKAVMALKRIVNWSYKAILGVGVSLITLIFMFFVLILIFLNDAWQYIFRIPGAFKEQFPKVAYKNGLLSLVILNWNGRHFLKELLDSLKTQLSDSLEVIISDNGSVDGSQSFIRENYPWVRLIENKRNLGFAKGTNAGIRNSRGEYIAVLNNDTVLDKNWVSEVFKGLSENPDMGIFGSKIYLEGLGKTFDIAAQGFSSNGRTLNVAAGRVDNGEFDNLKEVFGVSACAAIYRRKALEEIGLFDEDFFNSYEDNDLHFRAQVLGQHCAFLPQAIVYHKGTATIKVGSFFHIYHLCKNSAHPLIKNMPLRSILKNFFKMLVGPVPEFVFFAVVWNQPKAVWAGLIRALRDVPGVLAKRRYLRQARKVNAGYIESLLVNY